MNAMASGRRSPLRLLRAQLTPRLYDCVVDACPADISTGLDAPLCFIALMAQSNLNRFHSHLAVDGKVLG